MPKITIFEQDLTTVGLNANNDNVVYVPGYAITGPVNTPILCEDLDTFRNTFGAVPYKFTADQAYPANFDSNAKPSGVPFAKAGTYEKSYVFAAELLSYGLPVLFERVMSSTNASNLVAEYTYSNVCKISAKYPGELGKSFKVKLSKTPSSAASDAAVTYYTLEINFAPASEPYKDVLDEYTQVINFSTKADSAYTYFENINADDVDIEWLSGVTAAGIFAAADGSDYSLTYSSTAVEFSVQDFYTAVSATTGPIDRLADPGEFDIKYLTLGAYPDFEYANNVITSKLITAAAKRGDCVALISNTDNVARKIAPSETTSVYAAMESYISSTGSTTVNKAEIATYGAMIYGHGVNICRTQNSAQITLPNSFAYLKCLAQSISFNPDWLAVAGVKRGIVPDFVGTTQNITNAMCNSLQPRDDVAINSITIQRPYGYVIWANRTLKNNKIAGDLKATSFLNVRCLACDFKKVLRLAAKTQTFEQNTDILWLNFKGSIIGVLDKMVSGYGIQDYEIRRVPTDKRATVKAEVSISPIEPVEDWELTLSLTDTELTITE